MTATSAITLYGATGFTGRLVAEYLAQTYPELPIALAGRSRDKLQRVRTDLGLGDDVPLVVADAADPHALRRMTEATRCVVTTVGPYQLHGEALVAACAETGTDYADLSGEPAWMVDTVAGYADAARASGARIVHSCGFDSVPFDMGVYFLQSHARERFGRPCTTVRGRVRAMRGTFSGGTAASFAESVRRAKSDPEVLGWLKDPFALTPGFSGPAQPSGLEPLYEDDLASWAAPFIMAGINTKNIHRSNFLLDHLYGTDFTYSEMMLTGDGEAGRKRAEAMRNPQAMLAKDPPAPGEGPSLEERENGFYDILFVGETERGERLRVGVSGKRDPGYGSTSRMIGECALALVQGDPDGRPLDTPGGIYTPAPAFGDTLIARLEAAEVMRFRVEDQSS